MNATDAVACAREAFARLAPDLVVVNGLALEGTTIELAQANLKPGARILELGDGTITRDQWVFDFSFPEEHGDPNPHVWMNPLYALRYAELVRDALSEMDAANADYYRQNTELFRTRIEALDQAIQSLQAGGVSHGGHLGRVGDAHDQTAAPPSSTASDT